ncbi:hypothetical protein Gotur_011191 [Gossypium turneri]
MALTLPSVLGLSSLTRLNLRDCNLCEGDIPGDISHLSSLIHHDLGGNNFISIPSCVIRISKLESLRLSYCRALKSLPELLTSITDIRINGCASLEVVANPSKVWNSKEWVNIVGINCFRLAENIDALTLLKKHLKNVMFDHDEPRTISFRLGGMTRYVSVPKFGATLGLYTKEFMSVEGFLTLYRHPLPTIAMLDRLYYEYVAI